MPLIDIHDIVFYIGLSNDDTIFTQAPYNTSSLINFRHYGAPSGEEMFIRADVVIRPKY